MTIDLLTFLVFYTTMMVVGINLISIITRKDYKNAMRTFGGGGGKSAPPPQAPPAPPPPPGEDAEVVRQRGEATRRRLAGQRGFSSTDITSGVFVGGISEDIKKAKPTLLGG